MTSSSDLYCFSPFPRAAASPITNMQHVGLAMYRVYTERQCTERGITETPTCGSHEPTWEGTELDVQSDGGSFPQSQLGISTNTFRPKFYTALALTWWSSFLASKIT
jgi:hypothetical protein